ncbi:D-amino acid dehydrogenase [Psychrosphaera sp. B3R10]|uniref:D-amino acid dehydrogenase n=1 Tax=unclassified Psychrosphaera TaxID=2641570 RepID=UPI001C07F2F8|nr:MULTISPECIES: D-amino acid dehydrogenase [unclassified Psychrosphaera]MBU2881864.1 D-amino acid dehydrogenase [Psychrosphaera sp. I2R16]MBU2989885.1 D-amino acid dehydrogenase [Psychrosphaera sp. B3R10]MDO6720939.1 D-amino acid dehydrogenase [Psychrosphaera sp. 1_MG-2023]
MYNNKQVTIVGAGLAGLCSAYFLINKGYRVSIIEQQKSVALGASYANGGLLTPSMPEPWNAPGIFSQLLKYLGKNDAPMLLKPRYLHQYISWGVRFLSNSNLSQYKFATLHNMKLAMFSLAKLAKISEQLEGTFEYKLNGTIKVFRSTQALEQTLKRTRFLSDNGLAHEALTTPQLIELEPALEDAQSQLCGGIYYPQDATGNARQFCHALARYITLNGGEFHFNSDVHRLKVHGGKIYGVVTNNQEFDCQSLIITAGAWSTELLSSLGINIPVKPVKGYSLSVPAKQSKYMPQHAILDDEMHAAITPLGKQIRLAGTAEFSGWNAKIDPSRIENLWHFFQSLMPNLYANSNRHESESWCGFRPMSADGLPFIGGTHVKGLYVNTGHGPLGWTQAAGSAFILSQQITGGVAGIDASPYQLRN